MGRDLGIEARAHSAAALRNSVRRGRGPQRGDVLIVDEVALLDRRDVLLMLDLAERGVLVRGLGDEQQLSSIDQSSEARLVIDAARRCGQPWLATTRRCEAWNDVHDALRAAVEDVEDSHPFCQHGLRHLL
ncbi:MAG: AAA family ATPase [Acidimicrobiales bacterium]